MNTYTERKALEDKLENNKSERKYHQNAIQELRNEDKYLLQRLREIDERDFKSNSVDIMENLTDKLTDVVGTISKVIPPISAAEMIEHLQKEGTVKSEQVIPAEEKEPEPTKVQEAAQDQLLHMKPKKLSVEEASAIIKNIIEEKGEGAIVASQVIEHEFHKRTGLKYVAFSPKIADAMEIFPSIKRVSRGKFSIEQKRPERKSLLGFMKDYEKESVEA